MSSARSARTGVGAKKLYGSEVPRVFTPPLRELTPETTLGFDCIEFAEEGLGLTLFPWQKWFFIHVLELLPSGLLRFRKVVLLVARQNGKTLLSEILALYFMRALAARMILGTAQDLATAEDIWQDTFDVAAESDLLAPLLTRPKLGKGSKEFGLRKGEDGPQWSTYKVKAANRRGGRGTRQVKLVLFSEGREQQTWDAWGAITKTTNAVDEAMILMESNAGDVSSVVLRYLRMMAHEALGDPDGICAASDPTMLLDDSESADVSEADDTLAIFEWSALPECDIWDRAGWQQANPSLGYMLSERTLASDASSDPEWVFRTECLCQWSDGSLEGPFPPGAWEAGRVTDETIGQIEGAPIACIEVSWDRSHYAIVYGGFRADGLPQAEVVAYRYDPTQAIEWLTSPDRTVRPSAVILRESGPGKSLREALTAKGFTVITWSGSDISDGCGRLYDLVKPDPDSGAKCGPLRHAAHSVLDVAAQTALTRPFGDRWSWDLQKSPVDISPLFAMTGVMWALQTGLRPRASAYADHDLIII